MPEYGPDDRFQDPDSGEVWLVESVSVEYRVSIYNPTEENPDDTIETATVPQDTLDVKMDYGDLEPITDDSEDQDSNQEYACEVCEDTFDTEHGLATHVGQAHNDDDVDDVAE